MKDLMENTITPGTFSEVCRICLLTVESLSVIPVEISKIYRVVTDIEINEQDQLPQNICKMCIKYLEDLRIFVEKCKKNHSVLLVSLQKSEKDYLDENSLYNDDTFSDDEPLSKFKTEQSLNESTIKNELTTSESEIKAKPVRCDECDKCFDSKSQLIIHVRNHIKKQVYDCIDCSAKFKYKRSLLRHKRTHSKLGAFKCDNCGRSFARLYSRNRHKTRCVKNECDENLVGNLDSYSCTCCDRTFRSQNALNTHMMTHTREKPHSCTYCGKQFPYIGSLTIHRRLHTGERPYVCEICSKGYISSASLKKHKEVQHYEFRTATESDNDVAYSNLECVREVDQRQCKVCNKILHKHGFGAHMRIHTAEKKTFVCQFCSKNFLKNSHLLRHIRIHTGERPFTCDICNKSFVQDGDLKRHAFIHTGEKFFQCQHCGKQYHTKGALDAHISGHLIEKNATNFECNVCKKAFRQCLHYKMHMKVHAGERPCLCTICGKSFTTAGSLKVHTRIHSGETPFMCTHCSKGFNNSSSLKRHVVRNHTSEKSHLCMICHKTYYELTSLKRHVRRAHALVEENKDRELESMVIKNATEK